MLPWIERPTIDVDLALPVERRYAGVPAEAVAAARRLLAEVLKPVPGGARLLADLVRLRTWNRFQKEAVALARLVRADWRDVVLANISYDLTLAALGCSTVALPTPNGPVVARNLDWWPEDLLARSSYLVRCRHGTAFRFASAGWPGAVGLVTGLSARGFAVVLNAVSSAEGVSKTGYPVLLHLRRVVEDAADFDAALTMLTDQHLAAPALFTLVGSANEQRVVIERTPTRWAHRRAGPDEPLVVTNHYRLLHQPDVPAPADLFQTTCPRYDAVCEFFCRHRADRDVNDTALLYHLSDPRVIQTITAQHVVLRPRSGQVRLFVPRRFFIEETQGPG
jgi:hypothetical protein